jgi:chromosome segregation ATPase
MTFQPNHNAFKKAKMNPSTTLSELAKSSTALQDALVDLVQKQTVLMEKLDRFVNQVVAHEERLKRLEDNLLNHLESATWIKAAIRFWPILIVALLFSHQIHALLLNYRVH